MKKFISRLNPRLLLIHFVAAWFIIYAFRTLAFLYDIDLIKSYFEGGEAAIKKAGIKRVADFNMFIGLSYLPGILAAFTISLILSIRNKWYWVNSVIILFLSIGLIRVMQYILDFLRDIFTLPGKLFNELEVKLIVNATVTLLIALVLLFHKKIIRFIATGEASNQQITETANPLD